MISNNKTSNIQILGENIISFNNTLSAIYVIPGFNYDVMSSESIENHIDNLYKMIRTMLQENKEMNFCLSKIDIPITAGEIIENINEKISKWSKMEINEISKIKNGNCSLFLMEVFLEGTVDSSAISIKDLIKERKEAFLNQFTNTVPIEDLDRIFKLEEQYAHVISLNNGSRASRDIVFRYILDNYFPGFTMSIDLKGLAYNNLLKNINNFYTFELGYFKTENEFLLNIMNPKQMERYCSIMEYTEFPQKIYPTTLNLEEGTRIFIKITNQDKFKIKIKRRQADIDYTLKQNQTAGGNNEIEKDLEKLDLANLIVYRLGKGEIGCEARVVKMINANSLGELNKLKKTTMINNSRKNISIFSFINQKQAFFDYYRFRRPKSYNILCDLRYVLSTKIDNFQNVGDFDSKDNIGLIPIGKSLSMEG